jgi:RNA polymerase sigma factor (sigma-70 family)
VPVGRIQSVSTRDAAPSAAVSEQWGRTVRVRPNEMNRTASREEAWASSLRSGNVEGAWDAFLTAYRRLIFATIGRLVRDREERMDAFAMVCGRLRESDFQRLRRFDPRGPARFSTWLVTVVRNLVVDWHRQAHGRRRAAASLDGFSELDQRIYESLCSGMSFVEAYESLRIKGGFSGSYGAFLKAVRRLHREVTQRAGPLARELIGTDPAVELAGDPVLIADHGPDHERAMAVLQTLPADVRVATLLFVVDDVPADEVARVVGWPGRKAVYNRVYRALATVRRQLIEPREQGAAKGP